MIKLNDDSIFVGEIKQLLKNFNLPNCPIGKNNAIVNHLYIDSNNIYKYSQQTTTSGSIIYTSELMDKYIFNKRYINLTNNLSISNMLYDRETHRYLGNYLRFLRDYNNVDLMSMYNCFDEGLNEQYIEFSTKNTKAVFSKGTDDVNYIVYSLPVSKSILTLKTFSNIPVEMCIVINNTAADVVKNNATLAAFTYEKTLTIQPFLYNKLINLELKQQNKEAIVDEALLGQNIIEASDYNADIQRCLTLLKKYSNNLRLLVKIPKSYKYSIVILEGDYSIKPSYYYQYKIDDQILEAGYAITPQLFINTNKFKYLLADKLIEYLTGNAITPLSNDYDIKKLQKYLIHHNYVKTDYLGLWSSSDTLGIKKLLAKYDLMKNNDMLPYLDKNIEEIIKGELI